MFLDVGNACPSPNHRTVLLDQDRPAFPPAPQRVFRGKTDPRTRTRGASESLDAGSRQPLRRAGVHLVIIRQFLEARDAKPAPGPNASRAGSRGRSQADVSRSYNL